MAQRVKILTLADITCSGVTKVRDSNLKEYHQQQNLNVLLQLIGMRSQPLDFSVTMIPNKSLSGLGFSDVYTHETVWEVVFYNEAPAVWDNGIDQFHFLKDDIHGVAFSPNLDETADIVFSVFDTRKIINTTVQED